MDRTSCHKLKSIAVNIAYVVSDEQKSPFYKDKMEIIFDMAILDLRTGFNWNINVETLDYHNTLPYIKINSRNSNDNPKCDDNFVGYDQNPNLLIRKFLIHIKNSTKIPKIGTKNVRESSIKKNIVVRAEAKLCLDDGCCGVGDVAGKLLDLKYALEKITQGSPERLSMIIGTSCSYDMESVGTIAMAYGIPICEPYHTHGAINNAHTTVTKLSLYNSKVQVKIAISLLKEFGFPQVILLYDISSEHIEYLAKYISKTIRGDPYFDFYLSIIFAASLDFDPHQIMMDSEKESKAMIILTYSEHLRQLMKEAYNLGLHKKNYLFIAIEFYDNHEMNNISYVNLPWYRGDEDDGKVVYSYNSLLYITIKKPEDNWNTFAKNVHKNASVNHNLNFNPTEYSYGSFHDCITLFGASWYEGLQMDIIDFSNTFVSSNKWNTTFKGIIETYRIDENGQRLLDFSVWGMINKNNGTFGEIAIYRANSDSINYMAKNSSGLLYEDTSQKNRKHKLDETLIDWHNHKIPTFNRLKKDGELYNWLYNDGHIKVLIILIPTIFLIALMGHIYKVKFNKSNRLVNSMAPKWWKIYLQDLTPDQSCVHLNMDADSNSKCMMYRDNSVVVKYFVLAEHQKLIITPVMINEIQLMKDMNYEYLIKLMGLKLDKYYNPDSLVLENGGKQNLSQLLAKSNITLGWNLKYSLIHDILKGMSYIHSSKLHCHGRLRSSNIIITNKFIAKITGFGIPSIYQNYIDYNVRKTDPKMYVQQLLYVAPELIREGRIIGHDVDMKEDKSWIGNTFSGVAKNLPSIKILPSEEDEDKEIEYNKKNCHVSIIKSNDIELVDPSLMKKKSHNGTESFIETPLLNLVIDSYNKHHVGTTHSEFSPLPYIAHPYSQKGDVYSFAIILSEIITSKSPFYYNIMNSEDLAILNSKSSLNLDKSCKGLCNSVGEKSRNKTRGKFNKQRRGFEKSMILSSTSESDSKLGIGNVSNTDYTYSYGSDINMNTNNLKFTFSGFESNVNKNRGRYCDFDVNMLLKVLEKVEKEPIIGFGSYRPYLEESDNDAKDILQMDMLQTMLENNSNVNMFTNTLIHENNVVSVNKINPLEPNSNSNISRKSKVSDAVSETQVVPSKLMSIMIRSWEDCQESRPSFSEIYTAFRVLTKNIDFDHVIEALLEKTQLWANNLEDVVAEKTRDFIEAKKKGDDMICQVVPKSIAENLKRGIKVAPEEFECVTIYFSDVVNFSLISAQSSVLQIINFLNDLYSCFDNIVELYDVYKVETIGDSYMVASGLPIKNGNLHVREIARLSINILDIVKNLKIRHLPNEVIRIRIGFHTGSCAAGIVGLKMPRYCLFGDTINTASRMGSHGEALKIHMSNSAKIHLDEFKTFITEDRGIMDIKGKGRMNTFWLLGENV